MSVQLIWQPPLPPESAWGALFDHLDHQVLDGHESFETRRQLLQWSLTADMRAEFRRCISKCIADAAKDALVSMEKNKAPFWAKKWRGQR